MLLPLYVPWKPKLVDPLAGILPFQLALLTVTELPDWLETPFHKLVMFWLPGKLKPKAQPLMALLLLLLMMTLAVKPLPQSLVMV